MRVGSLFSGIGGLDLGLEWAGMTTVWQVERDEFCRTILARHFPHTKRYEDVNEIEWTTLAPVDLICGGYPCQPFSLAGQRKGEGDDRYLWPRMFEAIQAHRPAWVVCENVAGHITMGLDRVLSDLESEGYASQPLVLPACAVEAPHRRDRIFIVAYAHSQGQPHDSRSCQAEGGQGSRTTGGSCGARGSNEKWRPEPRVGRVVNGLPNRVDRLRALGNAVVPQVAFRVGEAIMAADEAYAEEEVP